MSEDTKQWHKNQVEEYIRQRPIYETYAKTLTDILKQVCRKLAPFAIVEARAKTVPSFAEKALRKRHKYRDAVQQLTDLCGARVITVTQEEVDRICDFIRENFIIDEANTEDKRLTLGASEFGYLSVHFIVQMRESVAGIPTPKEIEQRKAEIQVRTLLQHGWATITHDRIYKSEFRVPDEWQREMNRVAALLEGADKDFARIVESLELYSTSHGVYMSRERIGSEIDTLELIKENERSEKERRSLARRIASLRKSAGEWEKVVSQLEPYQDDPDPEVLRELGQALCSLHRRDTENSEYLRGRSFLEKAVGLDERNAEAQAMLGWSWEPDDEERAGIHYARAFELKPGSPYYLASYLEFQIAIQRQVSGIASLQPALRSAIETCRSHADVGLELPWSLFVMGKFHLLLDEPYEALEAHLRGVQLCLARGTGVPPAVLDAEWKSIKRLRPIRDLARGYDWMHRLLVIARSARSDGTVASSEVSRLATGGLEFAGPVVIVAGSCDSIGGEDTKRYEELLAGAFDGFPGDVISGGTAAGLSGIVGSLAARFREKGDAGFRTFGYHPRLVPSGVSLDQRYRRLVTTDGEDFSAQEALQMWTDLLANGVRPSEVKLIGIGGGAIAAFEYRLAAALGAEVGVVADSGPVADKLLGDPFWKEVRNISWVPQDKMSLKAFVHSPRGTRQAWMEDAARAVHEKYLEDNKHKIVDPSMVPWEKLNEELKDSNRQQAAYAAEILRCAGFGVRPAAGEEVRKADFSKDEVEIMAEMEHGRWNMERIRAGWKLGPRDPLRKTSPYLVPWPELPDDVKEWDRKAVRDWPYVLHRAGLEIYRLS